MSVTDDSELYGILGGLATDIRRVLGPNLIGIYLYGSLVTGDFDRTCSDIDLLAVTSSVIEAVEFKRLDQLHQDFEAQNPEWKDRLEIAYVSQDALRTYRSR